MGKLIICNGKQTGKPYYFKITNTNIYSIEELCFYIYHNMDLMSEELFGEPLATWIIEELDIVETGNKLKDLLNNSAELKDILVFILCSSDYYSEMEIKQYLHNLNEIANLTSYERLKKKADNYLRYRQFTEAAIEYKDILSGKETVHLTGEEYGNIVHNLAVVQLNTVGVSVAADSFKEAYERNHNIQSLKQYLSALKLSKQEDRFLQEMKLYQVDKELQEEILESIDTSDREAEQSHEYNIISELQQCKDTGKIIQYYQISKDRINHWKQQFRREIS